MSRVLPFPLLSLFLWATWMLLNGFSWGHALLGLVLAVVLPLGTQSFWPNVPRLRNFPKLVRFVLVVHWDILTANMAVAILMVLGMILVVQVLEVILVVLGVVQVLVV